MKVYKKKDGKILVLTNLRSGLFGGTEVVFMNYGKKGQIQSVLLSYYEYIREPTNEEVEKFGGKLKQQITTKLITEW